MINNQPTNRLNPQLITERRSHPIIINEPNTREQTPNNDQQATKYSNPTRTATKPLPERVIHFHMDYEHKKRNWGPVRRSITQIESNQNCALAGWAPNQLRKLQINSMKVKIGLWGKTENWVRCFEYWVWISSMDCFEYWVWILKVGFTNSNTGYGFWRSQLGFE